jgi:hypothetical protein
MDLEKEEKKNYPWEWEWECWILLVCGQWAQHTRALK